MKYTYDIVQWDRFNWYPTMVFCDMDPEALERHSAHIRDLCFYQPLIWQYRSPAKRFKEIHLHPAGDWMVPNALKFVFCAINRARRGKKIFLELPKDFTLAVQVHQVLIVLQVEDCIGPMHGHVRQIIRERPLTTMELETVWSCLRFIAPKIHEFALQMRFEQSKQMWSLGPVIEDQEAKERVVEHDTDMATSSAEDTLVGTESDPDAKMIAEDIDTDPEDICYDADEESAQEAEGFITDFDLRRTTSEPYFKQMYKIDISAFRECEDEEPEH
ncbi:unnamed protein product [Aureobasidium vineae]|uniref:Uncharacterized protein n=1 Tax=Aureobasidium vineae TaxID=2773715 RepID=A0A9N8JQL3_9PEZI|nr:unnamed protein product [Aureobasidium vineae]